MNEEDAISGFAGSANAGAYGVVDFSLAKRLDRGGSTCDAYETTLERRRVFIKRLKPQFRHNPLYLAAFDKEFDVGVALSHPSLPRYIAFRDDYIVMDYVEGKTLAELLAVGDESIAGRRNAHKILSELVDVVDYLHRRGVVHCDIKPDNVIVSPYRGRPITLIDLDKAYTAALNTTHGDPNKFDCRECADGEVDFRGIGKIAERLGMGGFARICFRTGVTADDLRLSLRGRMRPWKWIVPVAALMLAALAVSLLQRSDSVNDVKPESRVIETVTEVADSEMPKGEEQGKAEKDKKDGEEEKEEVAVDVAPVRQIDSDWIESLAKPKALALEQWRERLSVLMASDSLADYELSDSIRAYLLESAIVRSRLIFASVEHFSDFPELDVQYEVRSNDIYLNLLAEEQRLQDWLIKRFQR